MYLTFNQAAQLLKHGNVVAIPTETVYGLAACVDHIGAIEKIYTLKKRPPNNPLIIHLCQLEDIFSFVEVLPEHFKALAAAFWPGSLTLVVPVKANSLPPIVNAGLPSAAFRIPNHPLALEIIRQAGPLVMPSANLSGKPSSTSPEHVAADFGHNFPIVNGGNCLQGVESTVLCWAEKQWIIGRYGAIPKEDFTQILGYRPKTKIESTDAAPVCPGQYYRHYAPKARLHLAHEVPYDWQGAVIGFEDREYGKESRLYSLGRSSNATNAAQRLYTLLRELDDHGIKEAVVDIAFPTDGLWVTLLERLQKASI